MKTKQNADLEYVKKLKESMEALSSCYPESRHSERQIALNEKDRERC